MDVDEIYKGKEDKFLTVVCKLETGEPLWIVYDKFDALQHANDAVDEVRRAEFFRQGPKKRGLIKGKKWLLPSRWTHLTYAHRGELNRLSGWNRRVFKACLLKKAWRGCGIPLRRGQAQLPAEVNGSTEVAAPQAL